MPVCLRARGLVVLVVAAACARGGLGQDDTVRFNRDIRPILSNNCFACHGPDAKHREAELRFDKEESAKEDRGGYAAIIDGKPEASALIKRIASRDPDEMMPPSDSGKELTYDQKLLLAKWIKQGAKYEPHWIYMPPERPEPPKPINADWPRGDVDRFILARLEEAGVPASPDTDAITLCRRLYFDLLGLPPTQAQVSEFTLRIDELRTDAKEAGEPLPPDEIPQEAVEELVDQLLKSPHYGERMAMYWLDLVRYADTVGYHGDQEHHITPYRDWVILAFATNMPFDKFTTWQLAGDLLPDATEDQLTASGYNRLLQTSHEGGVQEKEYLAKYSADRVRNFSQVWMGATVGCAECHDHKYDPYSQHDFYSLAAFFADIDDDQTFRAANTSPTDRKPEREVISPLLRSRLEMLQSQVAQIRKELEELNQQTDPSPEDRQRQSDLADEMFSLLRRIERMGEHRRKTMITVAKEPRPIRVFPRGDWLDESGPLVDPATPSFLPKIRFTGDRLNRHDLAKWVTRDDHPQTARVFTNRMWYLFFGAGLSRRLDDTGSQGEWPTHPQLLDHLSTEFVDSGWDVKALVRTIVTSRAYRQSSIVSDEHERLDPTNRLFGRQNRPRLPAELIRDNALAVSGLLVDDIGGYSSRPYQPVGYYSHLNFPTRSYSHDKDKNQWRRGVYTHWQRQFLHPMLLAFDATSREECTAQRPISNTPSQLLVLMNDPTFVEASRVFAQRIVNDGGETTEERIRWAWQTALSRQPDDSEVKVLDWLYRRQLQAYTKRPAEAGKLIDVGLTPTDKSIGRVELAAWTFVARAIFCLSETVTRN